MTPIGITIIVLQIITGLFIAGLTNYVNQRGKNLANKTDLKDITDIVEDAKQKYQQENDRLKAELNILTDRKTQVFAEEKEALILFNTSINEWMWNKCNIPIFDFNASNQNQLEDALIALKNQYYQVQVHFSKVQLLVDNEELINIGNQFITENLKLHHFVESKCTNLKQTLLNEKSLIEGVTRKDFDLQNAPTQVKDFILQMSEKFQKRKDEVTTGYYDKHLELFEVSLKLRNKLQAISRQHLKS